MSIRFCMDCGMRQAIQKCRLCGKDLCHQCFRETKGLCLDCEEKEKQNGRVHYNPRQNISSSH